MAEKSHIPSRITVRYPPVREGTDSQNIDDGQAQIHTPYGAESMFLPQHSAAPTDASQGFISIDDKRDTDVAGSGVPSVVADMKNVRRAHRPIYKIEALRRIREAGEAQGSSYVEHPHMSNDSRDQIEKWLSGLCGRERRTRRKAGRLRGIGERGAAVPCEGKREAR